MLAVLLIITGIGLCASPAIAERFADRRHAEVIAGYAAAGDSMGRTRREALLAEAERYNAALAGMPGGSDDAGNRDAGASGVGEVAGRCDGAAGRSDEPGAAGGGRSPRFGEDPSIAGRSKPLCYADVLDPNGDGVMGVIAIPKIDLRLPIYHGVGEQELAQGVGHVPDSALPIGGVGNHSVLAGHRGLPSAELFTRLDELARGDVFSITVLGATHVYRVTEIRVVDPKAVDAGMPGIAPLTPVPGRDLVTLVTCTPYGVNTHRLLVTGERAPDLEADPAALMDASSAPIRIPTSPDAWFRSGWAAALAVVAALTTAGVRIIVQVRATKKAALRSPSMCVRARDDVRRPRA